MQHNAPNWLGKFITATNLQARLSDWLYGIKYSIFFQLVQGYWHFIVHMHINTNCNSVWQSSGIVAVEYLPTGTNNHHQSQNYVETNLNKGD